MTNIHISYTGKTNFCPSLHVSVAPGPGVILDVSCNVILLAVQRSAVRSEGPGGLEEWGEGGLFHATQARKEKLIERVLCES